MFGTDDLTNFFSVNDLHRAGLDGLSDETVALVRREMTVAVMTLVGEAATKILTRAQAEELQVAGEFEDEGLASMVIGQHMPNLPSLVVEHQDQVLRAVARAVARSANPKVAD